MTGNKKIIISADHGMALVYFLQSDLIPSLLANNIHVTLLTDDEIINSIKQKYSQSGLDIRGIRHKEIVKYSTTFCPKLQWVLGYLRRVGGSSRINTEAMDSHRREVWAENSWKFRLGVLLPCEIAVMILKHSKISRKALIRLQHIFTSSIYKDLLDEIKPDLVIASSPGWRLDRYLLREARRDRIPTMAAVIGWDNPSSYSIPGALVDYITCWSEEQKKELVYGSDWDSDRVDIGGMPTYDGYFTRKWQLSKEEYYKSHGLDPHRKLISYASSFVHFSPNLPNIEALVSLVSGDELNVPAQLLIRLHPSHFQDKPEIFASERRKVLEMEKNYPHVHVVHPVPLGGSLGYYSGEDMPEKSSMMGLSDVFVTVFSTMVVECAIHKKPIISACIDTPGGWNVKGKFSLALKEIGNWPTHQRFRKADIGLVVTSHEELKQALNFSLTGGNNNTEKKDLFIHQEVTLTDGTAGIRTADIIIKRLAQAGAGIESR